MTICDFLGHFSFVYLQRKLCFGWLQNLYSFQIFIRIRSNCRLVIRLTLVSVRSRLIRDRRSSGGDGEVTAGQATWAGHLWRHVDSWPLNQSLKWGARLLDGRMWREDDTTVRRDLRERERSVPAFISFSHGSRMTHDSNRVRKQSQLLPFLN